MMDYTKISGFSDEIDPSIAVQFSVLNKLGITYFEPRGINGKSISELNDQEVLALKAQMDACGIKASSIGSPIGKIWMHDDFAPHLELLRRVIRTAKMLDCRYIRMFSFYPSSDGWTEDAHQEVLRRLREMIALAEQEDVVLLHENEKDIYGDTVERCAELMHTLGCAHFRFVFDPANFVQSGQDTKHAYEVLRPYIEYMHIKDARACDGSVTTAGNGDGNVPYIISDLLATGYDGFFSLEPHLGSFVGLEDLEIGDEMLNLPKGGESTFTVACNALRDILKNIR